MGGSERELAAVTLEGWGRFVADIAATQSEPVMLCGHSRGGSVISTAAEMAPTAVRALVYIAAFLLPDGDSPAAFKARQPGANPLTRAISIVGDNAGTYFDSEIAAEKFYNTTAPADRLAASRRLLAEPFKPSRTPLRLSAMRFGRVPRHYVECTEDLVIALSEQQCMHRYMTVNSVEVLHCDHSPFLSGAIGLAESLARIERRSAPNDS